MSMTTLRPLLFFLALAVLPASADKTWKLPANEFFLERIPVAPTTGGAEDQSDLVNTLAMQATMSDALQADINRLADFNVFTFSDVLGTEFNAEDYPKTAKFIKKLFRTIEAPKNYIKDHYKRTRPYLAHPKLVQNFFTKPHGGYSYPSGHTTRSWATALVLGELSPPDKDLFILQAVKIGNSRILGGMHYQSDIIGGRAFAQLIVEELLKNKKFVADLEELKKEEWAAQKKEKAKK